MTQSRSYEKLSIGDFGTHLLESNDLDPIYVALVGAKLGPGQLRRWLLAYWCFYHAGVACYMSELEAGDFWVEMLKAARNTEKSPAGGRWPRAKERRHFRGEASVRSVEMLMSRYGQKPENMVV